MLLNEVFYKPLTQESLAFTKVQISVISHSKWWSLKNETIVVKCEYFFSKWKCQSWKFCFYQADLEVSTFSVNIYVPIKIWLIQCFIWKLSKQFFELYGSWQKLPLCYMYPFDHEHELTEREAWLLFLCVVVNSWY